MWLGTESWDERGEARAWQRRREQAGLDGAAWLSLWEVQGLVLMILGGRFGVFNGDVLESQGRCCAPCSPERVLSGSLLLLKKWTLA